MIVYGYSFNAAVLLPVRTCLALFLFYTRYVECFFFFLVLRLLFRLKLRFRCTVPLPWIRGA